MFIRALFNGFRELTSAPIHDAEPYLHSARSFHRLIERERMRSDRNGSGFCVIAIRFLECRPGADDLHDIALILRRRLRLTDDAGWLRDGRLGVLLPETPAAGARRVARDLAYLLEPGFGFTELHIYVHGDREEGGVAPSDAISNEEPAANGVERGMIERQLPMVALLARPPAWWKRSMDIVGALVGLVLFSPLLILTALLIKLTSRGPVMFTQWREGWAGRRFKMYKFRTMYVGAEAMQAQLRARSEQDGPAFKLRRDPRVTWLGRWLRKSCIDELPQLFNVLKGDMSLVGPRPLPILESQACEEWQRRRLEAVPGLTCEWQASGGLQIRFVDWMRMDVRYVRRITPSRDVYLLWRTLLAVITFRASH